MRRSIEESKKLPIKIPLKMLLHSNRTFHLQYRKETVDVTKSERERIDTSVENLVDIEIVLKD